MTFSHPYYLSVLFLVIIAGIIASGKSNNIKNYIFFCLTLGLITLILNLLLSQSGSTILYSTKKIPLIGSIKITQETVLFSLNMTLKLTSIVLLFYFLSISIERDRSTSFMMRYLPKSSLLFILVSSLIPQMKRSTASIRETMKLRGTDFGGSPLARIKSHYPILKILMLSSLEDSWSCAEALQARGFGSSKRTSLSRESFKITDAIVISGSFAASLGFILSIVKSYGFHDFYSKEPIVYGYDLASMLLIVIGLLIFPFIRLGYTKP